MFKQTHILSHLYIPDYSSMSENEAGYVQLHPLAAFHHHVNICAFAWRWRHWHKPKLKRQGHDVIEAPIVKLHKARVFDTKGKASRAHFFVSNNRRRRPWHGHVAILNCPKLIMSDHGTCDDSSFGIFN